MTNLNMIGVRGGKAVDAVLFNREMLNFDIAVGVYDLVRFPRGKLDSLVFDRGVLIAG